MGTAKKKPEKPEGILPKTVDPEVVKDDKKITGADPQYTDSVYANGNFNLGAGKSEEDKTAPKVPSGSTAPAAPENNSSTASK